MRRYLQDGLAKHEQCRRVVRFPVRGLRQFIFVFLALVILVPALIACDNDDDNTTSATSQATTTTSTQPTTTTSSKEPVKIGVISAWSGAMGMSGILADQVISTIEREVEERGGILGGRPLEFVKGDNKGTVAHAVAITTKMVVDDHVSVVTCGGVSAPEIKAVSETAEELGVLFVSMGGITDIEETEFTVLASPNTWEYNKCMERTLMEQLDVKTVAFLFQQEYETRLQADRIRETTEPAGIETVYYGLVPLDAIDLSPYLTKVKYEDPDALVMCLSVPQTMTVAKQMAELGRWGDMQVVSQAPGLLARKMPGAQGWIIQLLWAPGWDNPVSVKFEETYKAVNGSPPTAVHMNYYFPLWTAIHAIELAGTAEDREAIARAARSGNLQWESPIGTIHVASDGNSNIMHTPMRVEEGGELVPFQ